MKTNRTLLCIVTAFVFFACAKKEDATTDCGNRGGVTSPDTYMFWMAKDFGCGAVTVEVKQSDGTVVQPYHATTTVYETTAPLCNSTSYGKHATFDLYMGKTYTYKATCSGKSWTGSISVPCEQNQCKLVQLQ